MHQPQALNCNTSVCLTDIEGRSQASYTIPYNDVVSYGAQIGGIQVIADHTHEHKLQMKFTHDLYVHMCDNLMLRLQ